MSDMIVFSNVSKWYGAFKALDSINVSVQAGQTVVLCGASGSGKSTLLRTVNRLEQIQEGVVTVNGRSVNEKGTDINLVRRDIGIVFQQFNLFPHLSAIANVALPLRRVLGQTKSAAYEKARETLRGVGLDHRVDYMPADLSGGEEQRVAIARTLVLDPSVILFDEPTSALDPEKVGEVLDIMHTLSNGQRTIMCVTHEMGFARKAADVVWFMDSGKILEIAPPETFFSMPSTPQAKQFLAKILAH